MSWYRVGGVAVVFGTVLLLAYFISSPSGVLDELYTDHLRHLTE